MVRRQPANAGISHGVAGMEEKRFLTELLWLI